MIQQNVPVLIVGAGGAGLSLSLLLLQQGIQPLLIERRSDISIYPRARNLNFRTLEVLRGLGLAEEVHAAGTRLSQVIFKETLASSEQENTLDPTILMQHSEALSPDPFGWHCPQSRLEPILLATAKQHGGDVRYSTELVSFTQDDAGVTATLEERTTGRSYVVRSDYLIAADGAHSHIRETLGIPSQGFGELPEYFIFVYFHAPWDELIAGHEADGFVIKNADVQGIFLVGGKNLGMFLIFYPIIGYRYRSQTILSEDATVPSQDEIVLLDREELIGLPGTRVPHLWLERQGQRISSLDLLDGRFVLLAGPNGVLWCEAAAVVKASLGIELMAYRIGPDADLLDLENGWTARMGVPSEGAVLVRPDGFVAWRSRSLMTSPELLLEQVLSRILCRSTTPTRFSVNMANE